MFPNTVVWSDWFNMNPVPDTLFSEEGIPADAAAVGAALAEKLGAEDLLMLDTKHNKGENFERELTERWTAERWVKDSVPFTVAGDIRIDGVEIQIKLDGAELTNEKSLANLLG